MSNNEQIIRRRMHRLYLSRTCDDIIELSRELLGLHCWFHRNVVFSALIRGADISDWKTALTKTWLYRGTLHGVAYDDLPTLLAAEFLFCFFVIITRFVFHKTAWDFFHSHAVSFSFLFFNTQFFFSY